MQQLTSNPMKGLSPRQRAKFIIWSKEFVHAYLECGLFEKDSETAVLRCNPELEAQIFESVPIGIWRYAKKISCPVLALRGELSDTFFDDAAERLKGRISDYELKTIPNSGHFIPMEKPQHVLMPSWILGAANWASPCTKFSEAS